MNKLRFLWGRVSGLAKVVIMLYSAIGFLFGGMGAVFAMTGSPVLAYGWLIGWPIILAVVAVVMWIREQLTDYEDPPEPQKPGVEPDPFEEQP